MEKTESNTQEKHSTPRWARIAKGILLRLVVWGGVAGLVVLFFGDLRPLIFPRVSSSTQSRSTVISTRQSSRKTTTDRSDQTTNPGWPHLRGPKYDGCSAEKDLADHWPEEGPPILWIRELGAGYSGFTAVGDHIYTQVQNLYAQSVLCLDADTGQTIWEQRTDWPYDVAGMYPGPRATPTWRQGYLYYASPQGRVGCLDANDGRPIWSVNVIEQFGGKGHDFGYSCSPLVEDGFVIMPVGGIGASVVALNAPDGSTIWTSGDEPASYSSALPISLDGRLCVATFLRNALALFDLHSGKLLWQQRWSQGYDEHSVSPLYQEPYLMVACPFRSGAEMYRLESVEEPPDTITATRVWSNREFSNDIVSSVLIDGFIYGFDIRDVQAKAHRPSKGRFKCLELATGKVRWTSDRPGHASVLAADGKLILFNDSGEIVLARANPERYEELGRAEIFPGEICWTAPSLSAGRLFLRSPTHAACVFVGTQKTSADRQPSLMRPISSARITKPINWNWWVGGERECPFDLPDYKELATWYVISLIGVFFPAGLIAFAAYSLLYLCRRNAAEQIGQIIFWSSCFILGIAVTPIGNRIWPTFVFTWPVSLLVAQQITLTTILLQQSQGESRPMRLLSLITGLGFVALCLTYFHICRQLGMALQWSFLLGFAPSWPLAIPSAYLLSRRPRLLRDVILAIAIFTLFYWSCGGYMLWKGFH